MQPEFPKQDICRPQEPLARIVKSILGQRSGTQHARSTGLGAFLSVKHIKAGWPIVLVCPGRASFQHWKSCVAKTSSCETVRSVGHPRARDTSSFLEKAGKEASSLIAEPSFISLGHVMGNSDLHIPSGPAGQESYLTYIRVGNWHTVVIPGLL